MDSQHLTECLPALRRPARTLGSGIGRRSPRFKNLRRGPLPHSRCAMDACAHLCVKILSGLWAAREDAGLFSLLRALPNRQLLRRSMRRDFTTGNFAEPERNAQSSATA